MAKSDKVKSSIKAAIRAIEARSAFQRKLQREVLTYGTRTRKIGNAFRQKIFNKAFAAAGVNPADIKKRQRDNDASDKRFIQSLVSKINKNSRAIGRRQKQLAKEMLRGHPKHPQRPGQPGRPGPAQSGNVIDFVSTAYDISFGPPTSNTTWSSSIGDGKNLVRVRITDSINPAPFRAFISFYYIPPRSGILNATAVVTANGSNWWASQHQCVEATMRQSADAYIALFPAYPADGPLHTPDGDTQIFLDNNWSDWPGCSTDIGSNVVDKLLVLQNSTGLPVYASPASGNPFNPFLQPTTPIVIMVVCEFWFEADEAIGEIDFEQFDKCINAVGVIVNLQ
jgi:hypothetical protein